LRGVQGTPQPGNMGKRGPKPTDTEVLLKRGSWRGKERLRKAPTVRKREMLDIEYNILEEIKLLPGYDPYKGADDYIFKPELADKVIQFFHTKLSHVKGEKSGKAFILEAWQRGLLGNLFGWVHKETGLRRYRECFIEVGRKNGKTPLAAGILLYLLFEDGEPGAEIYGAASEYKQASLVFTHAWGMRNSEATLALNSKVFKGQAKSIEVGEPGEDEYGIYRVISSDSFAAHGFNTHGAVVDELHTQPNRDLVDALLTSTGARREPLIIYITTSDFEREGSICNEKEDYALRVCQGVIDDPSFLPVIYKAELEDDWKSIKIWKKANPNLGVSVSQEYLKRECKRAQETPTYENTFKRLHLNIRTQQDTRWIPLEKWDACDGVVDEGLLIGRECYAGLDLSSTRDITAFVMVFPHEDGSYGVLRRSWIPKENAHDRERIDKVPYVTWVEQNHITMTDGNVVDYDQVIKDIVVDCEKFDVKEIAFDRFGFEAMRQRMVALGVPEDVFVSFGQGFLSMSAPTKELEKLIYGEQLAHGGDPVLRWMAQNVAVEEDAAGNIKPSKKKSFEKIDGIVALIMALGRAITQESAGSIYETRGLYGVG